MIGLRDGLLAGDQDGRQLTSLEILLGAQPWELKLGDVNARDSMTGFPGAGGVGIRETVAEMSARPVGMALDDRNPVCQWATTLRYRCQVACPSTGITTASPARNGTAPSTSKLTTIKPHSIIVPGLARKA